MSDQEADEEVYHDARVMGCDALAAKRKQLMLDYKSYINQEKIQQLATNIYFQVMVNVTLKQGKRRAMMAKCAHEAYIRHGMPKDPLMLAAKFDVDGKKLMEAQRIFYSQLFMMGRLADFPKTHLSAKDLLPDIAKNFNYDDIPIEQLANIIDRMYEKTTFITRWAPRDVSIVTITWYIETSKSVNNAGIMYTKAIVKKMTKVAETKFKKIWPIIDSIVKQ